MKAENKRLYGYVEITHSADDLDENSLPTEILVKRKEGDNGWITIYSKEISNASDGDFKALDYEAKPKKQYQYRFEYLYDGDAPETTIWDFAVKTEFVGLLIWDDTATYLSGYSPSYNHQRTTGTTYVQPFYGRVPHAVRNGRLNYASGSCEGIFLPLDQRGEPCYDGVNAEWNDAFLDFLTNGEIKTLKTYDGHEWRIFVNDGAYEIMDAGGISKFHFDWTEIEEASFVTMCKEGTVG